MKIGDLNIIKAYLGAKELSPNNAFVGTMNLIDGGTGYNLKEKK